MPYLHIASECKTTFALAHWHRLPLPAAPRPLSPYQFAVRAAAPRWKGAIDAFRRFSATAAADDATTRLSPFSVRALALAFVTETTINKRCIFPLLFTVALKFEQSVAPSKVFLQYFSILFELWMLYFWFHMFPSLQNY